MNKQDHLDNLRRMYEESEARRKERSDRIFGRFKQPPPSDKPPRPGRWVKEPFEDCVFMPHWAEAVMPPISLDLDENPSMARYLAKHYYNIWVPKSLL